MQKSIEIARGRLRITSRISSKNQWKDELNAEQIAKLENKFRDFITKFSYD